MIGIRTQNKNENKRKNSFTLNNDFVVFLFFWYYQSERVEFIFNFFFVNSQKDTENLFNSVLIQYVFVYIHEK